MPYVIAYARDALDHLRALTTRQQRIVVDAIDVQLAQTPTVPTRNRKPMRSNELATWELRIGHLRVYYDVEEVPVASVQVRAIGVKIRERVIIAGREFPI